MAQTKTARRDHRRRLADQLEEGAARFMRGWKTQARRRDPVGDATYRGLELVHGVLRTAVRSLTHMEEATQPPHRAARPEPLVPQHHAARPRAHAAEATAAEAPARRTRPTTRPAAARRAPRESEQNAS